MPAIFRLPHRLLRAPLLASLICVLPQGTASAAVMDIRSYDGSDNNLDNPDWGRAGTPLLRLAPAAYPDGTGDTLVGELDRPNPRDVSNRVGRQDSAVTANGYGMTNMLWQWGQFIDHDITLVHNDAGFGTAPIDINDPGDPFFPGPMSFNRSAFDPATGTGGTAREQVNAITAYIDGSMVYGSSQTVADSLRTFSGGMLRTSADNLLPTETVPGPGGTMTTVFVAGDERVNEQVGLTAMHTVFMREHNRLAGALADNNPSLSDEQIYQTARKIVGAELQKITYEEFLPTLLGPKAPALTPADYDSGRDPGIANSFATALFRFGHTMLPTHFELRDGSGLVVDTLALRDAFFNPDFLRGDPANVARVLRGLGAQPAQEIDNMLVDGVRNFLFGAPGMGGLDLASLNIQRGRDHGLADYNTIRAAHGLMPITSFDQLTTDPLLAQALRDLYGTTAGGDDIAALDVWVAGLAETHLTGAAVGALVAEALLDQFTRLAVGDRFFYLWDVDLLDDPDVAKVINLDAVSLGQVLAWNAGMASAQADMFRLRPVPLPGAAWLLLGGMLMLAIRRYRSSRQHA